MSSTLTRFWLVSILLAAACSASPPGRAPRDATVLESTPDAAWQPAVDLAEADDLADPAPVDAGYACSIPSIYKARTSGIVRSPCAYDVSMILAIGGDVKATITPPTIRLEFPGGTSFVGTTDGMTFTATRITNFPFSDACNWQATETLAGTIDAGMNCQLSATYAYREMPVQGINCDIPCTIDAMVVIDRQRAIQ